MAADLFHICSMPDNPRPDLAEIPRPANGSLTCRGGETRLSLAVKYAPFAEETGSPRSQLVIRMPRTVSLTTPCGSSRPGSRTPAIWCLTGETLTGAASADRPPPSYRRRARQQQKQDFQDQEERATGWWSGVMAVERASVGVPRPTRRAAYFSISTTLEPSWWHFSARHAELTRRPGQSCGSRHTTAGSLAARSVRVRAGPAVPACRYSTRAVQETGSS
jgi:hypothetical protein